MKKYLVVLSLFVVMSLMTGCFEKVEFGPERAETPDNTQETKEKLLDYSFNDYLGKDKDGDQVKLLFDGILEENRKLESDEKIYVELNALRGIIRASNDAEIISKMKECIGDVYSSYDVTYSGDALTGKITTIYIKQTVGNRNDPEIPLYY